MESREKYILRMQKWKQNFGYITLVPIITLFMIIIVTLISTFQLRSEHDTLIRKTKSHVHQDRSLNCNIRLVESIPDGLNYSEGDPKFMSTYDAWNTLLDLADESLDIGSFYWTLRGEDVINHTTAAPGEAIFQRLLSNSEDHKLNLRIAQSIPTKNEPNIDTILLAQQGAANVRSVDFPRLIGNGVLHTKLWIADGKHFYLGSANMDWRSLTQVKELGVLAENCECLASDVQKIFEAYWYLGVNTSTIPDRWPESFSTNHNLSNPFNISFNENYTMNSFFSSSPPPLVSSGRTGDLDAIVNTILSAKEHVYIAVMEYLPLVIFSKPIQFWPYIDNALRKAAVENKVSIKLLISLWKHSNPNEDYFLRSLTSLKNVFKHVDIEVKHFVVPENEDQAKIPFGRVNHNKYMVTDNTAYIGTSNWSGDYFINTAGIGLILRDQGNQTDGPLTLKDDLNSLFLRDWNSPYALEFKGSKYIIRNRNY